MVAAASCPLNLQMGPCLRRLILSIILEFSFCVLESTGKNVSCHVIMQMARLTGRLRMQINQILK